MSESRHRIRVHIEADLEKARQELDATKKQIDKVQKDIAKQQNAQSKSTKELIQQEKELNKVREEQIRVTQKLGLEKGRATQAEKKAVENSKEWRKEAQEYRKVTDIVSNRIQNMRKEFDRISQAHRRRRTEITAETRILERAGEAQKRFAEGARKVAREVNKSAKEVRDSGAERSSGFSDMGDKLRRRQWVDFGKEIEKNSTILGRFRTEYTKTTRNVDRSSRGTWLRLKNSFSELGEASNKMTIRLGRLGRAMIGLVIAGAITFANSLTSALVAVGAQAVVLATSLGHAASTLGGVLVPAMAQAIPVIGIFAAALSRLSAITDAIGQWDLIQKQRGKTNKAAAKEQESAADSIRSAEESLADANRAVTEAQEGLADAQKDLTAARKEGRQELEDIILAEKEAALAARNSQLALLDAKEARRQAITGGDLRAVLQSEVDIPSARLSKESAGNDLARATEEANAARMHGISSLDSYQSALERVEDAEDAVANAQRNAGRAAEALADTRKDAKEAGTEEQTAAQEYLKFFLSELTDAERKLYHKIIEFRERWKEAFNPITDIILNSFSRGIDRASGLLGNDKLIKAVTQLARGLGDAIDRVTKVISSDKNTKFWIGTLKEARRNLKPITDIFLTLLNIFNNLAEGAAPTFRRTLKAISGQLENFKELTSDKKGLGDFFQSGLKHLKAWGNLLLGAVNLMFALGGEGGESALKTLGSLTDKLNEGADWLREHSVAVTFFFMKTADGLAALGHIVLMIGESLVRTFDEDTIEDFATIIEKIVIPALENLINATGVLADMVAFIVDMPILGQLLQWTASFLGIALAVRLFSSAVVFLFKPLYLLINFISGGRIKAAFEALKKSFILAGSGADSFGSMVAAKMRFVRDTVASASRRIKSLLVSAFLKAKLGATQALEWASKLGTTLVEAVKSSKAGQAVGRVISRALARVAAWVTAAQIAAATFVDTFIARMNKFKTARLLPFMRKYGKALGLAMVVALVTLGLSDKDLRVDVAEAGRQIGEWFMNAIIDAINAGVRTINDIWDKANVLGKLGVDAPNIPEIRHLDSNPLMDALTDKELVEARDTYGEDKVVTEIQNRIQAENKKITAIEASEKAEKRYQQLLRDIAKETEDTNPFGSDFGAGGKNPFFVPDDDELLSWSKQHVKNLKDLADAGDESAKKLLKAWRKANKGAKEGKEAQEGVNKAAKDGKDAQEDLGKETRGTTGKQDDQKVSAKKLMRQLGNLLETLYGTKKESRSLGQMIKDVTNKVLSSFGADKLSFDLPTVASIAKTALSGLGFAQGGFLGGNKNLRGPDTQLVHAAPGEAFLTGHQQQPVEMAMSYANQAGLIPYKNLDDLFAKQRGTHSSAPPSHFAKGGRVGGNYPKSFPDADGALPGLDAAAWFLLKNFGLTLVDGRRAAGTRTSTGGISDHTWGGAIDISNGSNPTPQMDAAAKYLAKIAGTSFSPGSISGGPIKQMLYRTDIGGNHFNHIHLALVESMAKSAAATIKWLASGNIPEGLDLSGGGLGTQLMEIPELKRIKIKGKKGPLLEMLQNQSDKLRKAANKKIADEAPTSSMGMGGSSFDNIQGSGIELFKKISKSKGWNFADWWAIDAKETGHGTNLVNPTSTARLRGQFLDFNYGKYGPGSDPAQNPSMREQIISMARYIEERYGNPTRALAHHLANNWYQKGGKVAEFDKGGIVPGPLGMPTMIQAHGGETVLPTHKFQSGGKVTSGKITSGVSDAFTDVRKAVRGLADIDSKKLDKFAEAILKLIGDGGLFDKLTEEISAVGETMAAKITQLTFKIRKGLVVQVKNTIKIANLELQALEKQGDYIAAQLKIVDKLLKKTERKLKKAESDKEKDRLKAVIENLNDRSDELQQIFADNMAARFDAQIALFEARLGKKQARGGIIEARRSIAELTASLNNSSVDGEFLSDSFGASESNLKGQQKTVRKELRKAEKRGDKGRVTELKQQLLEIQLALLQNVQSFREAMNAAFDSIIARVQLGIEELNLRRDLISLSAELAGGHGGTQIAPLIQEQGAILKTIGTQLEAEILAAYSRGDTARAEELGLQLGQNQIDILANIQEFRNALNEAFDFARNKLQEAIGNLDIRQRILELQGEISGNTNIQGIRDLISGRRGILEQDRAMILAEIEAARERGDFTRVEELDTQLLNNELALLENTKELKDFNGSLSDAFNFNTSAWQLFRTAILNGVGGVLPQYQGYIPQLASGGITTKDVVAQLHANEAVIPLDELPNGDINVNIEQPMEVADPIALSNAIAFKLKTRKAVI